MGEHTFSMDPHEGTGLFPIFEGVTFSEPHRGAFVMSIACGVVIHRWIGR